VLGQTWPALVVAVPVLFAPELRRALEQLGTTGAWLPNFSHREEAALERMVDELVRAAGQLARNRYGALAVLERETGLQNYVERGVPIDAYLTRQLLINIFYPNSPLHDGAVVLRNDRIVAASVVLPLTDNISATGQLGTRHRAAIGVSEVSAALAVVVSAESGQIAVAHNGRLIRNLDQDRLRLVLRSLLRLDAPEREKRGVVQAIGERLGLPVDLRHPERRCTIVLSRQGALVSRAPEPGPGGMPATTAGRLLALISSGFDSPVAAFRLIRRGGRVNLIHFFGVPPQGQASSLAPVEQIARQLTRYQLNTRLYLCPFEPVQRAIVANCPSPYRILLYRRMMLRIAAAQAEKIGAHGLITGDSLAQVASQTVLNLQAVNAAVSAELPIYRPVIGDDKVTIQAEARRIGTFAFSEQASDDCCSTFMPRSPALAASAAELAQAEQELDIPALVASSLAALDRRRFQWDNGAVVAA
jgi:uncharacterized protein (TIGR00159 family)